MKRAIPGAMMLLALGVSPVEGQYVLESATFDGGGGLGASQDYSAVDSMGPGGADGSVPYAPRTGYIGRLPVGLPTQLILSVLQSTVNEEDTRQVNAAQGFDDGSVAPLPASSVTWSIMSGPLASIDGNGLATAAAVYADSTATLRGTYQSLTSTLDLTVLEAIGDNFRTYAGDRLPDDWQVLYLGIDHPDATPNENGDSDGKLNLVEFAFGTNPGDGSNGSTNLDYVGTLAGNGTLGATGQPILRYEPSRSESISAPSSCEARTTRRMVSSTPRNSVPTS